MGGIAGSGSGGGNGSLPVEPSSGCGNANPSVGSAQSPLTVSGHQYYVKLPTNYDASQPYLALFMFNPTGNPIDWAENNAGFEANGARDGAIRIAVRGFELAIVQVHAGNVVDYKRQAVTFILLETVQSGLVFLDGFVELAEFSINHCSLVV